MFSSSLRSTLVALAASAIAVSATPALELKLSGANRVDGLHNLKIIATVINTGDETLKLLNDPRGVLNKLPTNAFLIEHATGAVPDFTGAKVKYVPTTAAKIGKEDAFTVLAPGQSASIEHDLSAAYNFTTSGAGSYSFAAVNRFHYIHSETGAPVELYATLADAHTADISGALVVPRAARISKRETYEGCSSSEKSALPSAASAAQSYAASALSYTQAHTSSTSRFTTWFGTFSSSHHSTIQTHYSNLNSNDYSSYTFDCTCDDSGTYAYVYPDDFAYVYLCGAFWQAPTTGTDSKGGTLIHESTHFTRNAGTQDYVYGQTDAKSLAKSNSNEAIMNADNHEYYAENNPALS